MDFLSDSLSNCRRVRVLIIMDTSNREALATYANYSICVEKVIHVLEQLKPEKGLPLSIRTDHGSHSDRRSSSVTNWQNGVRETTLSKSLFNLENPCKMDLMYA
jgi:putative transposase